MKITFRGWRREVFPHSVEVRPVVSDNGSYRLVDNRRSLSWTQGMTAYGKFEELALSGNFLAKFEFTPLELRNWLTSYLVAEPEAALQVIAEAQGDAIRHLSKEVKK